MVFPCTFENVPIHSEPLGVNLQPLHIVSFLIMFYKIELCMSKSWGMDDCNLKPWHILIFASSSYMIVFSPTFPTFNTNERESTPPTNMCRWFNVVMELVRFFLAWSSCLMSLVISFTLKKKNLWTFQTSDNKHEVLPVHANFWSLKSRVHVIYV